MPYFKHKAQELPCPVSRSRNIGDLVSFDDALSRAYRKYRKPQYTKVCELPKVPETAPDIYDAEEFPTLS